MAPSAAAGPVQTRAVDSVSQEVLHPRPALPVQVPVTGVPAAALQSIYSIISQWLMWDTLFNPSHRGCMKADFCPISQTGYALTLADGSCWQFSDFHMKSATAGRMAGIMGLEKRSASRVPSIMFSAKRNDPGERPFPGDAFRESRYYADIGLYLRRDNRTPDVLWEIPEIREYEMQFVIMQHALFPVYQQSIARGGLPLHAALAELNGKGVLLVGPSNSGKSTCSRRFPSYWRSICDDESLVVHDAKAAWQVHPFPTWSDYILKRGEPRWHVARSSPLSGIFFLKHGRQDCAERLGKGETAVRVNQSAMEVCEKYWRPFTAEEKKNAVKETFANACSLADKIPAFRLYFSRNGKFWKEIETILHEQENTR